MAGFRYASGNLPSRSDKPAKAICDRCGLMYRLHELKWESISAKGSPENRRSGLRVCYKCFDHPHPLAFRPLAIREKLPDAEALWQPRTDIFPIAYPVFFTLPGSIFRPNPLSIPQGQLGINLLANGIFVGPTCTAIGDANVHFNTVQYINEQTVAVQINTSPSATIGIDNNLYIVDSAGNKLRAQLNIT